MDLVGTTIEAKYRVVSKIGTGSMGDVYEAEHVGDGRRIALKVLRVEDKTLAARFLREAKTMSLFRHPNIVELVEVGKLDDGTFFFAAELVRGVTLRALIEAGPVETRRALAIARQILDALGHAHAMGVVHRDIKPENIMLADGGAPDGNTEHVKILDFGVAKLLGDTPAVLGEGTLTITGYGALGTPYYISPEAVLGRVVDARADLYSVGVLLFELLVGKPPYDHDDVAVLMRMHAAAPIPKLADRVADVTPELELVVSEALAKKPELRFKSAAEMIDAVDAAVRSLEPLPVAPAAPTRDKTTDLFGSLPLAKPPAAAASAAAPAAAPPPATPAPASIFESAPVPASPFAAAPPPHGQPLFSPPMPHMSAQPSGPAAPSWMSRLVTLANQHRKLMFAGMGGFLLIIIIAVAASRGGGKGRADPAMKATENAPPKSGLAAQALEQIVAGQPSKATDLLEREDLGSDAELWVVLGHGRIAAGRRLDGLSAYERAMDLDDKLRADAQVRTNVTRVLEGRDATAGMVALELAMRLEPPARDLIKQLAGSGKVTEVRRRAFAIAEREKLTDGIDRVESWTLDLAQATTCDERLAAVTKLRRLADPRAIPALKRARTYRCVEREVGEALAALGAAQ